jgi:hypothetical protein
MTEKVHITVFREFQEVSVKRRHLVQGLEATKMCISLVNVFIGIVTEVDH